MSGRVHTSVVVLYTKALFDAVCVEKLCSSIFMPSPCTAPPEELLLSCCAEILPVAAAHRINTITCCRERSAFAVL